VHEEVSNKPLAEHSNEQKQFKANVHEEVSNKPLADHSNEQKQFKPKCM
jgi:hypothetical protein